MIGLIGARFRIVGVKPVVAPDLDRRSVRGGRGRRRVLWVLPGQPGRVRSGRSTPFAMSSQEVACVSELTEEPRTDEPETAPVASAPDTADPGTADAGGPLRIRADPEPAEVETAAGRDSRGRDSRVETSRASRGRAPVEPQTADTGPDPETAQVEIHPEDPDDEWSSTPVRSGLRLGAPTAVLLGLLVLAGGFWGGAVAEKHHGGSSSGSSALSAIASRLAAARGGTGSGGAGTGAFAGAGGFGGATTSAASGIVTGVQGNILYVTDSSGALIKVVVSASVPVTRTAKSSLTGLQTGDTVVVQGTKATNGEVTATSVRATGQGVTAGDGRRRRRLLRRRNYPGGSGAAAARSGPA